MHIPRKTALLLTALSALCLAAAPAVHAVTDVYVTGSGGEFGLFDPTTGSYTNLGALTMTIQGNVVQGEVPNAIGFIGGTLYGLSGLPGDGSLYTGTGTDVFTINAATGAETRVGNIAGFQTTGGTVGNGTFYALSSDQNSAAFDTIDPGSLMATSVNPDTGIVADGLLVEQDGTLYAAAVNSTDELYNITTTGVVTDIGDMGTASTFGLYSGVSSGGTVYGFGGTDLNGNSGNTGGALTTYTIATGSGTASTKADYSNSLNGDEITAAAEGPAAVSPAPEPSQYGMLALMGLGLGGLLLRARQQPKAA